MLFLLFFSLNLLAITFYEFNIGSIILCNGTWIGGLRVMTLINGGLFVVEFF